MRRFMFLLGALLTIGCSSSADAPLNNAVPPVAERKASTPVRADSPVPGLPTSVPANSTYTDLNEKSCKELTPAADDDGVIYKGECPGTAGFKVTNLSTDHTQGLVITDPTGRSHKVDFRGPLGTAADVFLGDKIEWRTKATEQGTMPYAIIVRVNVQKEPGNSEKQDSNLAVAKITNDMICVTDIVPPSQKDQNMRARELSDTATNRQCMNTKLK